MLMLNIDRKISFKMLYVLKQDVSLIYPILICLIFVTGHKTIEHHPSQRVNPNNNDKFDWSHFTANNMTQELPELSTDWLMLGGANSKHDNANGDLLETNEGKQVVSVSNETPLKHHGSFKRSSAAASGSNQSKNKKRGGNKATGNKTQSSSELFDDDQQLDESNEGNEIFDDVEEVKLAGTQKEPECASHGRYYCTYKEDYPAKLVTEVTKYYKWPLEKLFRDLHAQIMPKLAQDSNGNLVCDSLTRVVRPGWARNTNDRWLVVINTENYHQYVTEVVCQYGSNSRCNFIPPCYYSSCQQRYNTQKLLVIDPTNPYRGPFLSEFLFPSCCVCYVPTNGEALQDRYRTSPASIYQRTMQQEASMNLNPVQAYNPTILNQQSLPNPTSSSENDAQAPVFVEQQHGTAPRSQTSSSKLQQQTPNAASSNMLATPQALGPGEIRRSGELYSNGPKPRSTFPAVELTSLVDNQKDVSNSINQEQDSNLKH